MGKLYKRGGTWYADYFDRQGRRRRESTRTSDHQWTTPTRQVARVTPVCHRYDAERSRGTAEDADASDAALRSESTIAGIARGSRARFAQPHADAS